MFSSAWVGRQRAPGAGPPGFAPQPRGDGPGHRPADAGHRGDLFHGRLGEAREVAAAIAYLIGRDATWITGTVLNVSGGGVLD